MSETMNKPYQINLEDNYYFFDLAQEAKDNVINTLNAKKVFDEKIVNLAVQKFLLDNKENLDISFNFDGDKHYHRRELFNLNYLTANNLFFQIITVSELEPNYIYISRKVFDSELVADFFIPIFFDKKENTINILGYANLDTLSRKIFVSSENYYKIDFKNFKNINLLLQDLETKKEFYHENTTIRNIEKFDNLFINALEQKKLPNNFIEDINYVSEELYYSLLFSEDLTNKYLQLQNIFYDSVFNSNSKIISFNEVKTKKLASISFLSNKLDEYNFLKKYALAATNGKNKVIVYEFDYENIVQTDLTTKVFYDREENTLTIGGLEKYIGYKALLYIDLTGNNLIELGFTFETMGNIFNNWNEDFFEKNKSILKEISYKESFCEEDNFIKEDYFDIKLKGYTLPENITVLLAILVEK